SVGLRSRRSQVRILSGAPSPPSSWPSARAARPLAFPLVDDGVRSQVDQLLDPLTKASEVLAVVLGASLSDPLIGSLIRLSQAEPGLQHPGPGCIGAS